MSWNDWTSPATPWKVDSNETTNDLRDNDVAIFDDDPLNAGKKRIRVRRLWARNCTYTAATETEPEKLTGSFAGRNFTITLVDGELRCALDPAPLLGMRSTGVSWTAEAGSDTNPLVNPGRKPRRRQEPPQVLA